MSEIIKEIKDNFTGSKFNIAILNEHSNKDIDIVFFTNDLDRYNTYENIIDFTERLENTSISKSFFLKHEHRNIGKSKKHIHLLFYPSIYFLRLWELPSFCTSLFFNSNVIYGSVDKVKELSDTYLLQDTISFNVLDYQIGTYAQIGIYSFLYLFFQSDIYSIETQIENLLYVYRFYIIEVIKKHHKKIPVRNIWNWEVFIKEFFTLYSSHKNILALFEKKQNEKLSELKNDDLIKYYVDFIKLISNKNMSI